MTTKELVQFQAKQGNAVIRTMDGYELHPIQDLINQPVEGLLYDLNRDEASILTFIDDPKWVNDYACMMVIRELKRQVDQLIQEKVDAENEFKEMLDNGDLRTDID